MIYFLKKIYDKLDDFDIVNSPFLDGDPSYGVDISQLIRFARAPLHAFNSRNKLLTAKLIKHGYRYHTPLSIFQILP